MTLWLDMFTSTRLTSPSVLLLLLRRSLLLREAPILLQRPDGALTNHRLPPELTVVDDFDDDGRHVELLAGESLWKEGGNKREKERAIKKEKGVMEDDTRKGKNM